MCRNLSAGLIFVSAIFKTELSGSAAAGLKASLFNKAILQGFL